MNASLFPSKQLIEVRAWDCFVAAISPSSPAKFSTSHLDPPCLSSSPAPSLRGDMFSLVRCPLWTLSS